ncbi:MAG: helix-turn-helix domain-containing protein [Pseudonocardiaceae bacterium]
MGSRRARRYYCRCGTHLAKDNTERQCARCQRGSRDKLITPPEVPAEFWNTEQLKEAFAAQHIGRVLRAYRTHPHHYAVYGPDGISQTLLGHWLGRLQPQVSKIETGPPIRDLDTLVHWARVLKIPPRWLWFRLPEDKGQLAVAEPGANDLDTCSSNGVLELPGAQSPGVRPGVEPSSEHIDEPEPVLLAPWNHRGIVEAVVVLSGGGRVKRRTFLALTGPALTAPAHQWLVHEPAPLVSGLAGRRVSGELVSRFSAMVAELRRMDDIAGGGSVLAIAQQLFAWVAGVLDRASYDESTSQGLHIVLAELGQLCGWAACDGGDYGLAQRYHIAGLRAAHAADDRSLGAHILASMANQATIEGQPTEAVTFVETALAGVRGRATSGLLAELHLRQARAFAVTCDMSACTAAISRARTRAEQLTPDDDPSWLYWLDPTAITLMAGSSMLVLGHPDHAVVLLDEGFAHISAPFVRDRQFVVTHLADARARPGKQHDLDAAVELGMESLDLIESLDSRLAIGRLRDLCLRLKPYAKVPVVREFLERAEGFVEGLGHKQSYA